MNVSATSTYTPRADTGRFISTFIDPGVLAATQEVAQIVLLEAQAIVPVGTGELRDSGHVEIVETSRTAVAAVVFSAPHAAYVEYGTGIRGAASPGAGPYPYSPTWPGMPARPYLRPALDLVRSEALGIYSLRVRY